MKWIFISSLIQLSVFDVKAQNEMGKTKNDTTIRTNDPKYRRNNTFVIEYDFKTKKYPQNGVKPWIHQPVIYKITNINRLVYSVDITSRDSIISLETAIPEVLSKDSVSNKTTDSKLAEDGAIEQASSKISTGDLKKVGTSADQIHRVIDGLSSVEALRLDSQKLAFERSMLLQKITLGDTSAGRMSLNLKVVTPSETNSIKALTDLIRENASSLANNSNSIKSEEAKFKNDANNEQLALISLAEKKIMLKVHFEDLRLRYRVAWDALIMYDMLNSIALNPFLTPTLDSMQLEYLNVCKRSFKFHHDNVTRFYSNLEDFKSEYQDYLDQVDLEKHLSQDRKKSFKTFTELLMDKANSMKDVLKKKDIRSIITKTEQLVGLLQSPETFEVTSSPIQPAADLVLFNISIASKDKDLRLDNARKFTHREFVRGGLRYDFSAGLVVSFGVGNRTYKEVPVLNSGFQIVREPRRNSYVPDIAGMFHASLRNVRTVTVGFTLGASINSNELSLNSLFPGISLMVGKSEKFVFTLGPALQKVSYLSSKFNEGEIYATSILNAGSIPTESTYRVGAFAGFSYNLTKKQKDTFKIVR